MTVGAQMMDSGAVKLDMLSKAYDVESSPQTPALNVSKKLMVLRGM